MDVRGDGESRSRRPVTYGFAMRRLIPHLAAAVLTTAATLKTIELVWLAGSGGAVAKLLHLASAGMAVVIAAELGLAAWLTLGWHQRWAVRTAEIAFITFALVAAWLWGSGATSCGCFGALEVPPWVTLLVDLSLAIGLRWWRSDEPTAATPRPTRLARFRATSVAVAGLLAVVLVLRGPLTVAVIPLPTDQSSVSTTIPSPTTTPAGSATVAAAAGDLTVAGTTVDLTHGEWMVVRFRNDCEHCQETVPMVVASLSSRPVEDSMRWAFLDVTDSESTYPPLVTADTLPPGAALVRKPDLWAETPRFLRMRDGQVISSSETLPSLTEP